MLHRRSPDESAEILAYGFEDGRLSPEAFGSALATHDRATLVKTANLLRARLASVETEITKRP